jgi:voltage-gated potassium channel
MDLQRRLAFALLLLVVFTLLSAAGYRLLGGEAVSLLDAVYMAVITFASVGYGEIVDTSHSATLRLFNIFVVLIGVAITLYVFSVVTAFLVEGEITNVFRRRKMQKRISELNDHYIVCGVGDTGRYVVEELQKTHTPFVIIEHEEAQLERLREHEPDLYGDVPYLIGDATDEELLDAAGLSRAKGFIAAVSTDKDNLVLTVLVRQKNPRVRIVARCRDARYQERMLKAGANATVSPNRIGGLRLASEVLRPHVVSFLDIMLKDQKHPMRIDEIEVGSSSAWAGAQLGVLNLRERYGVLVMAVKNVDGEVKFLPLEQERVPAGSVLIVMGDVDKIRRARHDANPARQAAQA